jgi:hypothetical protein
MGINQRTKQSKNLLLRNFFSGGEIDNKKYIMSDTVTERWQRRASTVSGGPDPGGPHTGGEAAAQETSYSGSAALLPLASGGKNPQHRWSCSTLS